MTYCYSAVKSVDFFYQAGDCGNVNHNLRIEGGDFASGDPVLSAILIQLGTEARANDQSGWWGDQFQPFPIGNKLWTLDGEPATDDVGLKIDEYIREALDPLVDAGNLDDVNVRVVKTISGFEANIVITYADKQVKVALGG